MENKYTATLYYFGEGLRGIFTTTQMLEKAGKVEGTETFTDVDAAKKVLADYFDVPSWSVKRLELPLTVDDFSGNIRPDGHFAPELDLGIFALDVEQDFDIVKNFSSFDSDDKIIICKFIEKALELYKSNTDGNGEVYAFLRLRLQLIISEFVRTAFHTEESQTPKYRIMLMERFNTIELDELKRMLLDVVKKVSIKELVENGDDINTKLANDFHRKVVAAMN